MHSFHLVGQCQINTVCSLILMAHQLHRMNHIQKAFHTSSIHITKSKVKSWCTVLTTQLITSTAMSKPSTISIYISIFTFQYFHFFTTCRNIAQCFMMYAAENQKQFIKSQVFAWFTVVIHNVTITHVVGTIYIPQALDKRNLHQSVSNLLFNVAPAMSAPWVPHFSWYSKSADIQKHAIKIWSLG